MICTMGTILDGALILMLSCFMPFHFRMVLLNETTIEGPSPEFHVGMTRNWRQVMGRERRLWFLPVYGDGPDGDGIHWPSPLVTYGGEPPDACSGAEDGRTPASCCGAAADRGAARNAQALEEGRLLGRRHESESSDDE